MTLPKAASTVVVLRSTGAGFEACLVRRDHEVAFMKGAHVFPGGQLRPADRVEPPDPQQDGVAVAIAALPQLPPADAVAHFVGARRMFFEETGIRIPHLDHLVPFAHWTTPDSEAKRYDVRFFLAEAPPAQKASEVRGSAEVIWMAPSEAVARCQRNEIALAPPTWTTLRWLERFTRVEDAMAWARAMKPGRVQPMLFEHEGRRMLALPGDPLYPAVEGFDTPAETRFVFSNGRWQPIDPRRLPPSG